MNCRIYTCQENFLLDYIIYLASLILSLLQLICYVVFLTYWWYSLKKLQKSEDTVINVDEEEAQPSTVAEQAVELPEG